jgi:hypothetical protein
MNYKEGRGDLQSTDELGELYGQSRFTICLT